MNLKLRLVLFLLCLVHFSISQNYTSRLFSKDQGLPDPYIYSVVQDQEGFLWLATGKGLVKFDGQVFLNYDLQAQEQDDIVYSGVLDKNNELWFGTFSGKIYKFDTINNRLKLYPKKVPGSVTKIIASSYNNSVYFFSKGNGIFILKKNALEKIPESDNYEITALEEVSKDLLLIGTDEGLLTINTQNNEILSIANFTENILQLQKLKHKPNCYFVSTTANGIIEIELINNKVSLLKGTAKVDTNFLEDVSTFYFNEENNDLYIGKRDEHFSIINLDNGKYKTKDEVDFLGNANSIFVDRESNVWVTTTGKGLYRFFRTEFDFIYSDKGSVFAITQDTANNIYYGTNEGVVITNVQGDIIKKITQVNDKKLGKVNALYFDKQNKLWIGTSNAGLFIIDPNTSITETIKFSTITNIAVNSINPEEHGSGITVCTNLDGVYNYEGYALVSHFSVQNSLLHNNVYYSVKSKTGKIYYATHNTAFNFAHNNQIFEIDIKNNGLISDFNSFAESANGNIMIGTNGDGVYTLNDTTINRFDFNNLLKSKFCKGLVYDNHGDLWLMQGEELYRYYANENILKRIDFDKHHQSTFNNNAFFKNKLGDLFFGTGSYVILKKNKDAANKPQLPTSYLVSLLINDSVREIKNDLILPNGKYDFKFEFSALSLKNSEEVLFKYKLEGRDDHWSEPTASRRIEFSNLTGGSYSFKILAFNSDGFVQQEPLVFNFTIKDPIWKIPFFWLIVIVILLIIIVLFIRGRTASLEKAKRKLERIVKEKTSELRKEKELVELSNKLIEEQNNEIKDSITYAKRIQDALLPDKKIIEDRSDKIFVFYQPRDIVSGDFYWLGQVNKLKIVVVADCTGHGVPGAFMSMIGSTLLNKIIVERKIFQPKDILKALDKEVRRSLKQYSPDATKDGMDLALICVDEANKKVIYCGALRPLFHVRNKTLVAFQANKNPIGGFNYGKEREYQEIEIETLVNDMLYIFTDGYADQFGGDKGKKFMIKKFKDLLTSVSSLELNKQEALLKKIYNEWKGSLDQVDDVLVIGVRL